MIQVVLVQHWNTKLGIQTKDDCILVAKFLVIMDWFKTKEQAALQLALCLVSINMSNAEDRNSCPVVGLIK